MNICGYCKISMPQPKKEEKEAGDLHTENKNFSSNCSSWRVDSDSVCLMH